MEWWQEFHFLRPYWLLMLIVPVLWGWIVYKNEKIQSSWADVCDEHLLNYLLIKGQNSQRRIPYILALIISAVGILALAGPTWHKENNPALSIDNPVMIIMNLSSDMQQSDVSPSRLERAKYVIKDVLSTFGSTESGLMVYSDEPFVISPLTEDTALIDNLLPKLDYNIMPANGDRLDRALDMAVGRMQSSGYNQGNLLVITADVGERFEAALNSAQKAKAQGFEVNIIKVSTQKNEKLEMVAQKGGGIYLNYNDNYAPLSNKINSVYQKELKQSENMQAVWLDAGYHLLWLPALLLLYYFRKGVVLVWILILLSKPACAGWFLNADQEAMRDFNNKNYTAAAQKFTEAKWRGAAAYKGGYYEQALKEFSDNNDVTAIYNQGNALAKSGKIDAAIKKYEEVLQQDADFEDAAYNLEYLKKLQQNQQQQQNQKNDNKQDKQDKSQQESGDKQQDSNQQEQQNQQDNQQAQDNNQQNNNTEQNEQSQTNQENSADKSAQNEQNEQAQQSDSSKQNEDENKNKNEGENQQMQNEDTAKSEQNNSENQKMQNDSADDNSENNREQQQNQAAQNGEKDEQSEQSAKQMQVQSGDKTAEDKEKIKARMQQFREVPEDAGGLLRALIAKEYSKNRYKDE